MLAQLSYAQVKAFPTAEGFGSKAVGGRGGQVIQVTNLNDSGLGSFREAVNAVGPRIIVFRVGGVIALKSVLNVTDPYLTIAGQTAPGDGIVIKGYPVLIKTHDVIIRHMRFRAADDPTNRAEDQDSFGLTSNGETIPSVVYNIVLDHVSASWGPDETLSLFGNSYSGVKDVTIQWSIIAEGLHCNWYSTTCGAKGSLIGYDSVNITAHHNLWAHNYQRNPNIAAGTGANRVDVINNVMYNWGSHASQLSAGKANFIKNYYKRGPNSSTSSIRRELYLGGASQVYLEGNIGPYATLANQWAMTWNIVSGTSTAPALLTYQSLTRLPGATVTEQDAATARDLVLATAGARIPKLDSTDTRLINDYQNGTGKFISRVHGQTSATSLNPGPSDIPEGTFPSYLGGTPYLDSDKDGMSDSWESAHGLNPFDPSDSPKFASNGYTNIENFINGLAGDTTNTVSTITPSTILSLTYNGKLRDRVGRSDNALAADKRLDGTFTVTLKSGSGIRTVTSLSLTQSEAKWDTTPNSYWIAGAAWSLKSRLLNSDTGKVNFLLPEGAGFKLFVSDDSSLNLFASGTKFTLVASFADGSSTAATVTVP